ncbi:MAG: serine/threonine protein kinase [Deltaproteobacteria bacterium]|nr:serine/threonine protein kinase [Deltaproteobacteria bacterium]
MEQFPKLGQVIAGKYRLDREIGEGTLGKVFAATHIVTEARFALKCLRAELSLQERSTKRFLLEAKASFKISHPNVIQVYDIGEFERNLFIVMELLSGSSLEAEPFADKTISYVIDRLIPAMEAIQAAHNVGIIHRDIKPNNLFAVHDASGQWIETKVLDFGASILMDAGTDERITSSGNIVGTPIYMAPEQIRGEKVDERTDVYGLGNLLFWVLTGDVPFKANNFTALLAKKMFEEPAFPDNINPAIPSDLKEIVLRAIATNPAGRFRSVSDLILALRSCHVFSDVFIFSNKNSLADERLKLADTLSSLADERLKLADTLTSTLIGLDNKNASNPSVHNKNAFSWLIPPLAQSYFGGDKERIKALDDIIKFYTAHLDNEYNQLSRHLENTHRLWITCVVVFSAVLAFSLTMSAFGNLAATVSGAIANIVMIFLVKVFRDQENRYREMREKKTRHLTDFGRKWLVIIQSIDMINDLVARDEAMKRLVSNLIEKITTTDDNDDELLGCPSGKPRT